MLDPRKMTQSQVQAAYEKEVAHIKSLNEHPQAASMALNEARRWLDNAISVALPDAK